MTMSRSSAFAGGTAIRPASSAVATAASIERRSLMEPLVGLRRRAVPVEPAHDGLGVTHDARPQDRVALQLKQSIREQARVAVHPQCGAAERLVEHGEIADHTGRACGKRLERREPETLVMRD